MRKSKQKKSLGGDVGQCSVHVGPAATIVMLTFFARNVAGAEGHASVREAAQQRAGGAGVHGDPCAKNPRLTRAK
jgi:hypothetical protein